MSRRDMRVERVTEYPPPPPSKCAKVLYYTWKLCSLVFSHFVMISLVVAYCILGAVTFERLEAQHEREVKMNISQIRSNTTQSIWHMTRTVPLLNQTNWTSDVVDMLKDFENAILLEMKVRGWDGNESTDHIQWTFTGALFYSIIVITTIGYGHIAPKTQTGKVVTIFYAILGIPLMLLCLSNIGDVMASSFRFLYWRVCCYVCTRPPKRSHRHHHPSTRRSMRASRRRRPVERAHSDTDFRYRDSGYSSGRTKRVRPPAATLPPRTRSQPPLQRPQGRDVEAGERSPALYDRYNRDMYQEEDEDFPKISLPLQDLQAALKDLEDHQFKLNSKTELAAYDGDRRWGGERYREDRWRGEDRWEDHRTFDERRPAPRRLCRLYTVDDSGRPRNGYSPSPERDDWSDELPPVRRRPPSAWGSRQSDLYAGPVSTIPREEIKPVPIWLCVLLVASYIVAGTFLFKRWEGWAYLDAAYFCFITLTTIGFGDFVPAQGREGESADAVHSIALCSLYLLFGIALLAMSFNLVQEEVRAHVAAVATRLGIIKPRDPPDHDY
ncbi:PREDICTED: uncharacterized protein LOC106121876 [Papilio xuthus]|uniref:Uncharacterized protein LOC106121876 n=1 Tax=Papilio xuthus TaxID=66420 RepID=A0AAJ6ZIB9_PAPXU|nr:PREDICTED: uncharacterized protein LOC106121876 [Papilio xuthus]